MTLEQNGRALSVWVGDLTAMRFAIRELMAEDLVMCSACDQPAKYIDFQDAAEWYPHCPDHHYGFGEQWTGNTHFRAHHLWVAVYPEKAEAWIAASERKIGLERWRLERYDNRNLYDLIADDDYGQDKRIVATAGEFKAYVRIRPLTNGEYAYEVGTERPSHGREYGWVGTFASVDEAMQHAMQSDDMPGWAKATVAERKDS